MKYLISNQKMIGGETKFEIRGFGNILSEGYIKNNILEDYKGREEQFDREIKFIIMNKFLKDCDKSGNTLQMIVSQNFRESFDKINGNKSSDNLELPVGMQIDLLF